MVRTRRGTWLEAEGEQGHACAARSRTPRVETGNPNPATLQSMRRSYSQWCDPRARAANPHWEQSPHVRLQRCSDGVLRCYVAQPDTRSSHTPRTARVEGSRQCHAAAPSSATSQVKPSQSNVRRQHGWVNWPTASPLARFAHPSATRAAARPPHQFFEDHRWRGQPFHQPPPLYDDARERTPEAYLRKQPCYEEPTPRAWNFIRPDLSNPPSARDRWRPPRPGDWHNDAAWYDA